MGTVWYFAYGSNMTTGTLRGRRQVSYRRALAARVPGWRLVLDKPPLIPIQQAFANIVADPAAEVFGVLYELSHDDLDHIELTEGVRIGNYDRVDVSAWPLAADPSGPVTAASLSSGRRDRTLLPSRRYMDLLIEGAIEHGLPDAWIDALRSAPVGTQDEESAELRAFIDAGLRRRRPEER